MLLLIWGFSSQGFFTAFAFVVGAAVSMLCGALGMMIATNANFRTTYCAKTSLSLAFRTAYRAGCAMGFALVSLGLLGTSPYIFSASRSHPPLQEANAAPRPQQNTY
jgi:Na+/H+-translocating membrane pyrophosphatase